MDKEALDKVSEKDDLLNLTFKLSQAANIQRTYFVMTGQLGVDSNHDGTIDKYTYNVAAGINKLSGKLYFKRTDARITFNVTAMNKKDMTISLLYLKIIEYLMSPVLLIF